MFLQLLCGEEGAAGRVMRENRAYDGRLDNALQALIMRACCCIVHVLRLVVTASAAAPSKCLAAVEWVLEAHVVLPRTQGYGRPEPAVGCRSVARACLVNELQPMCQSHKSINTYKYQCDDAILPDGGATIDCVIVWQFAD